MADITFFTHPMSRGQIARWALHEAGADYEQVLVGWDAKPAELLAVNPLGKVPTIIHHAPWGERTVSEAAAVCAYLAAVYPDADLAPRDAELADYFRWMFFAAGPVDQAMTAHSLGLEAPADRQSLAGYGTYDLAVDTLEKAVSAQPYIAGDRFTAADVYVGSMVGWGMSFGLLPKRPAFEAYLGRVYERPAAVRAREIDDALIAKASA